MNPREVKSYYRKESRREWGLFRMQIDWLLECAVYAPSENYQDSFRSLWETYMPAYEFTDVLWDYAEAMSKPLQYLHEGNLDAYRNRKDIREYYIKNRIKWMILQGTRDRTAIAQTIFGELKDYSDRSLLYDDINMVLKLYFDIEDISQDTVDFLRQFADKSKAVYPDFLRRLQQRETADTRKKEFRRWEPSNRAEWTRFHCLLCKVVISEDNDKFLTVMQKYWNEFLPDVPYPGGAIQEFVTADRRDRKERQLNPGEKNAPFRPYMETYTRGLAETNRHKDIKALYRDSLVLLAACICEETPGVALGDMFLQIWSKDGKVDMDQSHGQGTTQLINDMNRRMDFSILPDYGDLIRDFHSRILQRYKVVLNCAQSDETVELEDEISADSVLANFITMLDSNKYGYVLGRLFRVAYEDEKPDADEMKLIIKNFFEILNINGINTYGEIGEKVDEAAVKSGAYRLSEEVMGAGKILYPGYKIADTVALRPVIGKED